MASENEELIAKLQAENAALRTELEFMRSKFRELELEEEHITNQLLKRLEEKKREKELLLQQVEQEEEYLTNTLGQKLLQLRKEKVEMENQLEQEEEFLTNKLQKILEELTVDKKELEKKLEESENSREKLKKEVEELKEKSGVTQNELNTTRSTNQRYRIQLKKLQADNFVLSQKANSNQEKLEEIKKEKFLLEADMELKNENEFNVVRKKRGRSVSCNVPAQQPVQMSTSVPKTKPIQISRPPVSLDQDDDIFSPGSFGSVPGSFGSFGSFKTNPLSIPSKDKSFNKTPPSSAMSASPANSFLSNSYMESFLQSRAPVAEPGSSRTCVKRGWLKTLQSDDGWSLSMFVVYDNGDLLCCSSESGVTVKINLDTVLAIIDRSKFVYDVEKSYPPHTFEMKTKFCSYFVSCETEKEFQEWTELLEELSPLC